jgi:hypothetical protein
MNPMCSVTLLGRVGGSAEESFHGFEFPTETLFIRLSLLFVGLETRRFLRLFAPIYNWREIKSWSVCITSKQNA